MTTPSRHFAQPKSAFKQVYVLFYWASKCHATTQLNRMPWGGHFVRQNRQTRVLLATGQCWLPASNSTGGNITSRRFIAALPEPQKRDAPGNPLHGLRPCLAIVPVDNAAESPCSPQPAQPGSEAACELESAGPSGVVQASSRRCLMCCSPLEQCASLSPCCSKACSMTWSSCEIQASSRGV